MKVKKTDWFPPEIKPVHVGFYETQFPLYERGPFVESRYKWWWNGEEWCYYTTLKPCITQDRKWRGFVQKL